jgi:hypothetical protein
VNIGMEKEYSNYIGKVYDFDTNDYLGKTLISLGFDFCRYQMYGKEEYIRIYSDTTIKKTPNKIKIIMDVFNSNMVTIYQKNYIYEILKETKDTIACYKCKLIEEYETKE